MKKLIIGSVTVLSVCLAGLIIYFSLPSSAPANTSHAYEYYYNKEDTAGEPDFSAYPEDIPPADTIQTGDTDREDENGNAVSVDTEPSSITVLVNHQYNLPADYIPEDLVAPDVTFNFSYMEDKRLMRSDAAAALEDMFRAAESEGISLCAISGYRSYIRQNRIYLSNVRSRGEEYANRYSAPPGHSEHQTGLTMDVSSASNSFNLTHDLGELPEGIWMRENAHRFGFIIRYPEEKEEITGYSYEPWHVRYVGTELARHLYENNLTLDEYYGVSAENYEWTFDFDAAYRLLAETTPQAAGNGGSGSSSGNTAPPEKEPEQQPEKPDSEEPAEKPGDGEPKPESPDQKPKKPEQQPEKPEEEPGIGDDPSDTGDIPTNPDGTETDPEQIPDEPQEPDNPAIPVNPVNPDFSDGTDPSGSGGDVDAGTVPDPDASQGNGGTGSQTEGTDVSGSGIPEHSDSEHPGAEETIPDAGGQIVNP